MDHQIVLMICIFFSVITTSAVPLFANIIAMYVFGTLAGVFNGCIDTLGNVWIIHLCKQQLIYSIAKNFLFFLFFYFVLIFFRGK